MEPATPPAIKSKTKSTKKKVIALWVLALFVFAAVVASVRSLGDLAAVTMALDPLWVAASALITVTSYVSFVRLNQRAMQLIGLDQFTRHVPAVVLPATTLGYLTNVGGATGPAARVLLFSSKGMDGAQIGTMLMAQMAFTSLCYSAILVVALVGSVYFALLPGWVYPIAILFLLGVLAQAGGLIAILRSARAQTWILGWLERLRAGFLKLIRKMGGRPLPVRWGPTLAGVRDAARNRPQLVPPSLFWAAMDWGCAVLAFHFALLAVAPGTPVWYSFIAVGLSTFLSGLTLIPGGLGVMEGSMTAILAGLGIPAEAGLVASILFRVIYFVIPFFLCMLVFRREWNALRQWANAQ